MTTERVVSKRRLIGKGEKRKGKRVKRIKEGNNSEDGRGKRQTGKEEVIPMEKKK